ncbi:trace amine-associated receptor 13c-like [Cheilinus undulatus]|uniref:trace amine-associated receptor 13c-like n=1 Tax=Cheilinus undulatus TaxID=241271 RepID=UPI001BD415B8|nr:trace amine-associated receptor 13c-like [Cheilinus undulatus]
MTPGFSSDQLCFPGFNVSCVRTQFNVWTRMALFVVFALGMGVTILGNAVVIVSISHFKQLHSPTNVLISSLALVDLLVGVFAMPFSAIRTVHGCWFYGEVFCELHSSFDVFLTTLSILHLICIAVDRHEAICNPLHYSMKITIPVAWIMVCWSWVLAAVYSFGVHYSKANVAGLEDIIETMKCLGSCFLIYNQLWGILDSVLSFFFSCTVMVCLYTKIFTVAKEHARKISNMKNSSNDKGAGGIKQSEHKAAKTLSIVLGAFIVCWMPLFTVALFESIFGSFTPVAVFEAFFWLGYFNSTLNPIIYALCYPSFKKCFYCIITLKIFSPNSSTMNISL